MIDNVDYICCWCIYLGVLMVLLIVFVLVLYMLDGNVVVMVFD